MEEIPRQGVRQLPRRNPRELSGFGVEAVYLTHLREEMVAPDRQAYAVKALSGFWSGKTCGDIDEKACRAYTKWRAEGDDSDPLAIRRKAGKSTSRRELGVLSAALNSAHPSVPIRVRQLSG